MQLTSAFTGRESLQGYQSEPQGMSGRRGALFSARFAILNRLTNTELALEHRERKATGAADLVDESLQ